MLPGHLKIGHNFQTLGSEHPRQSACVLGPPSTPHSELHPCWGLGLGSKAIIVGFLESHDRILIQNPRGWHVVTRGAGT